MSWKDLGRWRTFGDHDITDYCVVPGLCDESFELLGVALYAALVRLVSRGHECGRLLYFSQSGRGLFAAVVGFRATS